MCILQTVSIIVIKELKEKRGIIMYEVDARGLSCPEPLMLVSDALKSHPGEKLKVLVSEPHSRTNIEKFVKSRGLTVLVKETGSEFELTIEG